MDNKKVIQLSSHPQKRNYQRNNIKNSEHEQVKEDYNMQIDTFLKEIKEDMREREARSERRYQEQQELLLNRVDKKLDENLGDIKDDIKGLKSSNWKWGIGIIVSVVVAIIGALPQLLQLFLN